MGKRTPAHYYPKLSIDRIRHYDPDSAAKEEEEQEEEMIERWQVGRGGSGRRKSGNDRLDGDDSDPGCNAMDPDDEDGDDDSGDEDRGDFQIVTTNVRTQRQKKTIRSSPTTATTPSKGLFMPVWKTAAASDADYRGGASASTAPAPPRPPSWDLKYSPAMSNVSSESITDRVCREIEEMKSRLEKANRVDGEKSREGIMAVDNAIPITPPGLGKKTIGSMSVFRAMMDKSVESIDTGSYDSPVEADGKNAEYFGINSPARDCHSIGTQTDFTFATSLDSICWKPEIAERQENAVEGEDAKISLAVARQEQDLADYPEVPSSGESRDEYDESEEEMQEDGSSSSSQGGSGELADIAIGKVAERVESIEKGLPPPTADSNARVRPRKKIVRRVGANRTTFALSHSSQCEPGCKCESAVEEMVDDLGYAELMTADADGAKKPRKPESIGKGKMRLRRGITMDTGAHHNVMPRRMVGHLKVRSSPGSRIGMSYVGAGGEKIKNEGEVVFPFKTMEGHSENVTFQVAEVNKPLGAAAYFVDSAYRVVYDKNMATGEDMSYIDP